MQETGTQPDTHTVAPLLYNDATEPPPTDPFKQPAGLLQKTAPVTQPRFAPAQTKRTGEIATALPVFKPVQKKSAQENTVQSQFNPIQRKSNKTGLPDNLKSGIEQLSGMDISDVKVHYNSPKPAPLQAHAFAQGTDIHVAAGQEKHLPHEAWHVVQQKQGRVQPTTDINGTAVNDDTGLENEADTMGSQAIQKAAETKTQHTNDDVQSGNINTLQMHKELHGVARQLGNTGSAIQLAGDDAGSFLFDTEPVSGKMAAAAFLSSLKSATTAAAEQELSAIGQTTANCPFIDYWISFYQNMPAAKIEKGIHIYAPATVGVTDPAAVIQIIAEKVSTGLRAQIAENGLEPVDPSEPSVLKDGEGEVNGLTPPKQLKAQEVAQLGSSTPKAAAPVRGDKETLKAYRLRQRLHAIKKMKDVVVPGKPLAGADPVVAAFTPGEFKFASQNEGDKIGSIYFNGGRIRLEHPGGPELSVGHEDVLQFTVESAGKREFNRLNGLEGNDKKTKQEIYNSMKRDGLLKDLVVDNGLTILEFFGTESKVTGSHLSRGKPVLLNLTQDQINLLCAGAKSGNNAVIRNFMDSDQGLKQIKTGA